MDCSDWGQNTSFIEELVLDCPCFSQLTKFKMSWTSLQVFFLSITSHDIPSGLEATSIRLMCQKIRSCFKSLYQGKLSQITLAQTIVSQIKQKCFRKMPIIGCWVKSLENLPDKPLKDHYETLLRLWHNKCMLSQWGCRGLFDFKCRTGCLVLTPQTGNEKHLALSPLNNLFRP